ncbi:MAG: hypothetical protein IKN38_01940 [Clostridia bacterium]|nr:hypothetical protein [Clostridia bacterium]
MFFDLNKKEFRFYYTVPKEPFTAKDKAELLLELTGIVNKRYDKIDYFERQGLQMLEREIDTLAESENIYRFMIARDVCDYLSKKKVPFYVSGDLPGTLAAYLAGISPVDPFEPYYLCRHCKEHFTNGYWNVTVRDGIDLPKRKCPYCGKILIHGGHGTDAGLNHLKNSSVPFSLHFYLPEKSPVSTAEIMSRLNEKYCDMDCDFNVYYCFSIGVLPTLDKVVELREKYRNSGNIKKLYDKRFLSSVLQHIIDKKYELLNELPGSIQKRDSIFKLNYFSKSIPKDTDICFDELLKAYTYIINVDNGHMKTTFSELLAPSVGIFNNEWPGAQVGGRIYGFHLWRAECVSKVLIQCAAMEKFYV